MRRLKQIGVDTVLMGGPRIPWDEAELAPPHGSLHGRRAHHLQHDDLRLQRRDLGTAGRRRADRHVITSIRAAGRVGLKVVEYNFYAHRLVEGYKEEIGRAGAGYTAYDYALSKALPPKDDVGTHTRAEQLKRAKHFLEAVVPEAEKAGVRLALHPNDPPVPLSRGSEQLMATLRALEGIPRPGQEPVQRHDLRLRRHARAGGRPGGGVPLPRRARSHQPRPLPQRHRPHAVDRLHRGVPRRRPGGHVRR